MGQSVPPSTAATQSSARAARTLPAGAIIALAGLVFGMARQGAYHQWQHQVFATVILIAGLAIVADPHSRRTATWAAVVCAPLATSSLISLLVSDDASDARSTFLTIALVAVALAAAGSMPRAQLDVAYDAVVLVASIVACTAIYGVAVHDTPWGRITEGIWRGSSSLTYANAAAAVVGPTMLLTFCRAARTDRRVDAAATMIMLVALVATQSRAGIFATVLVCPILVRYLGIDRSARAAIAVGAGAAISTPALVAFAPDDRMARPWLVAASIVAGLAVTLLVWPRRTAIPRPARLLAAGLVFTVGVLVAVGAGDSVFRRFSLRSGTTAGGEDAAVLFGDRGREWSTAWERVLEAPIVGHGPGVVDLAWIENGRQFRASFVHNEYLELLVTHGFSGLAALCVSGWIWARRVTIDDQSLPALAALAVFVLHSGADFLWHVPALPVFAAFLAGLATTGRTRQADRR